MEKEIKRKIFILLICIGILPLLLLFYLYFVKGGDESVATKEKVDLMIKNEKNLGLSIASKNAWYITSLLRKVEVTGRIIKELAENVFKPPISFVNKSDYKKYLLLDDTFHFYWSKEKENSVLFISSLYETVYKDKNIPIIPAYFNNIFGIASKNNSIIHSIYIMTDVSIRKYPWMKLDDLMKADLFKVGAFKVKSDSIFSKEETSPYQIASFKNNKAKTEIWTTPFWNEESNSWMISYYAPIYVKNEYKGVIGIDISLNKIINILLGEDQNKKFIFEGSYPIIVSQNGILVGSSNLGYENLKINPQDISSTNLLSYGDTSFKNAISKMIDAKLWDPHTLDSELGGIIEKVYINNKEIYIFYYPIRTANLVFAIISPSASVEKIAVTCLKGLNTDVSLLKNKIIFANLIIIALTIILMIFIASAINKVVLQSESSVIEKAEEIANIKIEQEKRNLEIKMLELQTQNANLQKITNELEDEKKKYVVRVAELEKDKNDLEEKIRVITRENEKLTGNKKLLEEFENDKKNLLLKINEVQSINTELQNTLNKLKLENEDLTNKIKKIEAEGRDLTHKLISKFEEEKKMFNIKTNELTQELTNSNSKRKELEVKIKELENNIKVLTEDNQRLLTEIKSKGEVIDRSKWISIEEFNKNIEEERKKYESLKNENQKLLEKMKLIEEKKLEADKQVQKLLLNFDEEKKNLNLKIEELISKNKELESQKESLLNNLREIEAKSALLEKQTKVEEKVKEEVKEEVKEAKEKEIENNILIVDDQGEIIKIFGDVLYNIGYTVYIARNIKLAFQKLAIGNYKYVILNTNIGGGGYKEFYDSVKKTDSSLVNQVVFFITDESKDAEFFKDKKIIKSSFSEQEMRKILN